MTLGPAMAEILGYIFLKRAEKYIAQTDRITNAALKSLKLEKKILKLKHLWHLEIKIGLIQMSILIQSCTSPTQTSKGQGPRVLNKRDVCIIEVMDLTSWNIYKNNSMGIILLKHVCIAYHHKLSHTYESLL